MYEDGWYMNCAPFVIRPLQDHTLQILCFAHDPIFPRFLYHLEEAAPPYLLCFRFDGIHLHENVHVVCLVMKCQHAMSHSGSTHLTFESMNVLLLRLTTAKSSSIYQETHLIMILTYCGLLTPAYSSLLASLTPVLSNFSLYAKRRQVHRL